MEKFAQLKKMIKSSKIGCVNELKDTIMKEIDRLMAEDENKEEFKSEDEDEEDEEKEELEHQT